MRLIDADATIKVIHDEFDECIVWDESGVHTADVIETILETLPTVEVVRCKDCVLSEFEDGWVSRWCNFWDNCTEEDGYCSYGKRRQDEID